MIAGSLAGSGSKVGEARKGGRALDLHVFGIFLKLNFSFQRTYIVKGSLVEKLPIYEQDRRVKS